MILRTVGMLYRYVAVLHRRFPLLHTTIGVLLSLSLTSSGSLSNPLSQRQPLSQSGAQRLRFTVASRSFACSRAIRITRVRYLYSIVRPHAWSTAYTTWIREPWCTDRVATKITPILLTTFATSFTFVLLHFWVLFYTILIIAIFHK